MNKRQHSTALDRASIAADLITVLDLLRDAEQLMGAVSSLAAAEAPELDQMEAVHAAAEHKVGMAHMGVIALQARLLGGEA